MKNINNKYTLIIFTLCLIVSSCNKWTEVKPKEHIVFDKSDKTEAYYQQLRDYKKSDHAVSFGWFGNWSGVGSSLANCMAGLPDSVDFISMWGGWRNPTQAQIADLRFVQNVKGTKALMCFIVQNIGDQLTPEKHKESLETVKKYWGWIDGNDKAIEAAIRKYANAICDTIDKHKYDGFDIDYEPNYGHSGSLGGNDERMTIFCDEMSKRVGPKSGTEKLFVIDGEPQSMPASTGPMFDYFIVQAYQCSSYSDLDRRIASTINNFNGVLKPEEVAKKYIVTENFESYSETGGVPHTTRDGKKVQSLEGMARWNPIVNGKSVRKAGVGTYHMEYEYVIPGKKDTYPYLREAIRIMNPSVQ